MNDRCNIIGIRVNEKAARANALLTVGLIGLFFLTPLKGIAFVLAADFFIRGFWKPHYSPLSAISCQTLNALHIPPSMIDAGPKQFAAKIGFVFSLAAGLLWVADLHLASYGVAAALAICAALEGLAGFCVGCVMYSVLQRALGR